MALTSKTEGYGGFLKWGNYPKSSIFLSDFPIFHEIKNKEKTCFWGNHIYPATAFGPPSPTFRIAACRSTLAGPAAPLDSPRMGRILPGGSQRLKPLRTTKKSGVFYTNDPIFETRSALFAGCISNVVRFPRVIILWTGIPRNPAERSSS